MNNYGWRHGHACNYRFLREPSLYDHMEELPYLCESETAGLLISTYTLIICRLASGHLTPILSNSKALLAVGKKGTTKTQRRSRRSNNTVSDDSVNGTIKARQ